MGILALIGKGWSSLSGKGWEQEEITLKMQFTVEVDGGNEDRRSVFSLAKQPGLLWLDTLFLSHNAPDLATNLAKVKREGLAEPLRSAVIEKLRTYHSWRKAHLAQRAADK